MGILRLFLALSVVATHFGAILNFNMVGGELAVESFFIISGFYMSLILNEKYIGADRSYKLFLTNRFLRLYPIYWAVLLLTFLLYVLQAANSGHYPGILSLYLAMKQNVFSFSISILTNLLIFGQDIVMYMGINPNNWNLFFTSNFRNAQLPMHVLLFIPQAWSLGIELVFYIIAPFLLHRKYRNIVALIILSVALRFFIYHYLDLKTDPWTYRFFPTELVFFLLGNLSYRMYKKIKTIPIPRNLSIAIFCFIISFTVFYSFLGEGRYLFMSFTLRQVEYFMAVTLSVPFLFNYFKKNKFDNAVGELSYPVYISHVLVGTIMLAQSYKPLQTPLSITLATLLASWLLNRLISAPIERYRQSRVHVLVR